jgi:hypothetical protein
MATLMKVDIKLRQAISEYQDKYLNIEGIKLPMTVVSRYVGETKIPRPNELDILAMKCKFGKRR